MPIKIYTFNDLNFEHIFIYFNSIELYLLYKNLLFLKILFNLLDKMNQSKHFRLYYNTFINERFEYFKFLENIFLGVSLELEKTKLGEHSLFFEMNANPLPVLEFISSKKTPRSRKVIFFRMMFHNNFITITHRTNSIIFL